MAATVQPESKSPSRRALLAGALGGLGAWAAAAVGRRSPVRAADPNDVVLGAGNTATSLTSIANTANGNGVFSAASTSTGTGITGSSSSGFGVKGSSSSGTGVNGTSQSSTGVYGASNDGVGVYGQCLFGAEAASVGWQAAHGTGVLGYSSDGSGALVAPKPKTGVFGYANQDSAARGVWGHSPAGIGVYGQTSTGYAGYFLGKVYSSQFYELTEIGTPPAPGANKARLFVRDNGAGKTQLLVRFATGSVKLLATEG